LGRRHPNNFQRTELALKSKSILQEIANKNSRVNLKQQRNVPSVRNLTVGGIGGRVDEQIAGLAGVSRDTVRKVEAIQQSAEEKPHLDFIVKRARNGEISTNEAHRIINDIDEESEKQGRWYKLKEEVMKSDGNKCRDCSSILHLEVYTIDRYGDKYELENLETLCEDCHRLKKQFGGSGIIAAFAWMFQHLTGCQGGDILNIRQLAEIYFMI
jgi:hypothetical protein